MEGNLNSEGYRTVIYKNTRSAHNTNVKIKDKKKIKVVKMLIR